MPRYFFDIDDGERRTPDDLGLELSLWEARDQAVAVLPDIARDVLPDGERRDFVSSVRDESGQVVYTATLSLVGRWKVEPPSR
jgi:hypothetical protein